MDPAFGELRADLSGELRAASRRAVCRNDARAARRRHANLPRLAWLLRLQGGFPADSPPGPSFEGHSKAGSAQNMALCDTGQSPLLATASVSHSDLFCAGGEGGEVGPSAGRLLAPKRCDSARSAAWVTGASYGLARRWLPLPGSGSASERRAPEPDAPCPCARAVRLKDARARAPASLRAASTLAAGLPFPGELRAGGLLVGRPWDKPPPLRWGCIN